LRDRKGIPERCADQNEQDHRALVDAVRSGRVKAEAA
jgi:hypothetical protein